MAIYEIEDLTGSCSLICFPDAYETHGALLKPDEVVFVKGKMNTKKEVAPPMYFN